MDDLNEDRICIYVGNFGNNNRGGGYVQRVDALQIFKFPEPAFPPTNRSGIPVATIVYDYKTTFGNPDRAFDAEAMFVDWTGASGVGKGDIYIVTKGLCGEGVGVIRADQHRNLAYSGNAIANIGSIEQVMRNPPWQGINSCNSTAREFGSRFKAWQGADMSRNGRMIAMIVGQSPSRVYFFPRETGKTVEAALSGPTPSFDAGGNDLGGPATCDYVSATSFGLVNEKQWEAVAFIDRDGTRFAEVSECNGGGPCRVPVYIHNLLFDEVVSSSPSAGWVTITFDGFEDGTFGNFRNGQDVDATDCPKTSTGVQQICTSLKNSATRSCGGSWSVELRQDNAISSSVFHKLDQNCTPYSWLRVTFDFRPFRYEHMDTLLLELSLDSGNNYYIVGDWSFEVGGLSTDNQCYSNVVSLKASSFGNRINFGPNVRLRFRASSDSLDDFVYIDNIRFEGHV
jgi:hypothetical protein